MGGAAEARGRLFGRAGTAAQVYFGVLVALSTLLLLTRFAPYADWRVDLVAWTAHVSTLLTLLCALALHARVDDDLPRFGTAVVVALPLLQLLPLLAACWLVALAYSDARVATRRRRPRPSQLSAAMRDDEPKAGRGDLAWWQGRLQLRRASPRAAAQRPREAGGGVGAGAPAARKGGGAAAAAVRAAESGRTTSGRDERAAAPAPPSRLAKQPTLKKNVSACSKPPAALPPGADGANPPRARRPTLTANVSSCGKPPEHLPPA